jgi:hypothetical protein
MVVVRAGTVNARGGDQTLARPIAVSISEITRAQFDAFVRASEYQVGVNCRTYEDADWEERSPRDFRNPGFVQHDDDPAVCLTWFDARAYVAWLNGNLGVSGYRLPTEAEWRYLTASSPHRLRGIASQTEWSGDCARISSHPPGACVLRKRVGPMSAGQSTETPPLTRDSATSFRVVRDIQAREDAR